MEKMEKERRNEGRAADGARATECVMYRMGYASGDSRKYETRKVSP